MTHRFAPLLALLLSLSVFPPTLSRADTTLFDNGLWALVGATDPSPDAAAIGVTVDKEPAGAYSELRFYYNVGGTNLAHVYTVRGSGLLQPIPLAPGLPGGVYQLSRFMECGYGLSPVLGITTLEFKSKANKRGLQAKGTLSNFDSLESTDLALMFYPPTADLQELDVSYKLTALRDFCLDQSYHEQREEFQAVTMLGNYLGPATNDVNRARYVRLLGTNCNPYTDCSKDKDSYCADLYNVEGYIFDKPLRMGDPEMWLLHSTNAPANTFSLAVSYTSPNKGRIKPQGYTTVTTNALERNVRFWGSWVDAKGDYNRGQKVGKFKFTLFAESPQDRNCKKLVDPPVVPQ